MRRAPAVMADGGGALRPGPSCCAQWLGAALPLTYFLTILRGVLLKGVGLEHLWPQTLALRGFAAGLVVLSLARFHKTIE